MCSVWRGWLGQPLYFKNNFSCFLIIFFIRHSGEFSSTERKMLQDLIFCLEFQKKKKQRKIFFYFFFYLLGRIKAGEQWQGSHIGLIPLCAQFAPEVGQQLVLWQGGQGGCVGPGHLGPREIVEGITYIKVKKSVYFFSVTKC